jgi:hypothetical protein
MSRWLRRLGPKMRRLTKHRPAKRPTQSRLLSSAENDASHPCGMPEYAARHAGFVAFIVSQSPHAPRDRSEVAVCQADSKSRPRDRDRANDLRTGVGEVHFAALLIAYA